MGYIATIIVLIIILVIIIYKLNEKKNTIKAINSLYYDVQRHLGTFIEIWEEDSFIARTEKIQKKIENNKYNFKEAIHFLHYKAELPKLIYNNNIDILERCIVEAHAQFDDLLGNGKVFVITPNIKALADQFKKTNKEYADKSIRYESRIINKFMSIYDDPEQYINDMNLSYMDNEKIVCKEMFDDIDGRSLDENQRDAVVNDDLRQLVIAGAGSGKTLTMSAKVKYLVKRKGINPKDILLISFTRKAAEEMGEKIRKLGIDIDSATFHKYGLSVIRGVEKKIPDIADDLGQYIDAYLREVVFNDDTLAKEFLILLGTLLLPIADINDTIGDCIAAEQRQDLTTIKGMYEAYGNKKKADKIDAEINNVKGELDALRRKLGPLHEKLQDLVQSSTIGNTEAIVSNEAIESTHNEVKEIDEKIAVLESKVNKLRNAKISIKNEKMKSSEEVMLANMFFIDGVQYTYEAEYPYDEKENYRKKYHPDFYLSESDVYWEHFGIDERGRAPQYTAVAEKQYLESLEWKRSIHEKNGTNLAETYSWQFRKNTIVQAIETNYERFGIKKHPVRYCDVIKEILKGDAVDNIESFKSLLSTFISLFKSCGYDINMFNQFRDDIDKYKVEKQSHELLERRKKRDTMFLDFAERFYTFYNSKLNVEHKIDFNDMIMQATGLIEHGIYIPSYKYVIIDEYQDISMGRFLLARATLEKCDAKLFCVGDDWQSIYRFSGSEVDLLINFETYFGLYSKTFIDKTYRNSQELLDIAGAFVMQNDYQTPKKLKSDKHIFNPLRKCWYTGDYNPILEDEGAEVDISMGEAFICAVDDIVKDFPNGDILVLGRNNSDINGLSEGKEIHVSQIEGETRIILAKYPELTIKYLTVHRSKGLEADNVILINMKNSRAGFPNQIVDDPVINLLRRTNETFPFAEERRLFYVAITRTKNRTYLLVPMSKSSRFIFEIDSLDEKNTSGDIEVGDAIKTSNDSESVRPLSCPVCKIGTLVKRKDAEGRIFVSCSNFPTCNYKASNLESVRKNIRCPVCDNFLTTRNGKYGKFLGCMSYPYCTYSIDLNIDEIGTKSSEINQEKRVTSYANKIAYKVENN